MPYAQWTQYDEWSWEHACYLQDTTVKADYIDAICSLVKWSGVKGRFDSAQAPTGMGV